MARSPFSVRRFNHPVASRAQLLGKLLALDVILLNHHSRLLAGTQD
jgi:hypothetical protein